MEGIGRGHAKGEARRLVPAEAGALRNNNLDAIRLAMAVAVVWSHSFALWFGSEAAEPISRLTGGTYNAGNLAVLVFFAISGFLITHSFLRSAGALRFLRKRIARIVPGYFVATLLCSLVVVPLFAPHPPPLRVPELRGLASNLLLRNYIVASDAFGGGPVNGSLWSIPYEFWCYLGVLALGLAGMLRRRVLAPVLAAGVMGVRAWLDLTGRHPGGGALQPIIGYAYLWFTVLPPFLIGMAIYLYRDRLPRRPAILLALFAALLASTHLPLPRALGIVLPPLIVPPLLGYGTFMLAFSDRVRLHHAARHGDISYGTYLYAFPIQQMLAASLHRTISFPAYVLLSVGLSLLAGVASWMLVERWFVSTRARRPLNEEANLVAP